MRRSGEIVHDSARSPTSLVPVRSVGSTRISVLYCGAPGCSIAKVSSWWASKLGGSAATTKTSSPPRRGVSWAAAGVTSSETRASAVRNVFMAGIILAPMKTIVALPGEGIGVEVVEATCALLSGAGMPVKVVTRDGAARIARFACELARRRKARGHAGKVTCVTKSNVLPQTDGLFHAIVKETVATYPDLAFEHFHVDDAARRIIRFPKTMDVVVCMNQYADILSDVAGEVAGGLGVAPSANFGDGGWAYFESVHGSAPDIAGRGIANPTGTLLSAALMLEHLGLAAEAERLQAAVARVYRDGKTLTPDQRGTATTKEMVGAVLAAYRDS